MRVTLDHTVLNFNSTPCGVDGACELDQDTIAGSLDDATAMIRDLGFQEFASMSIDPGQRTLRPRHALGSRPARSRPPPSPIWQMFWNGNAIISRAAMFWSKFTISTSWQSATRICTSKP
jgi:hypothetical protein